MTLMATTALLISQAYTPSYLYNEEILYLVYVSVFRLFHGLYVLFWSILLMWVMRCVDLRDNIFFPHFVQHLICSKDLLIYLLIKTKKGSDVVGISWSYIILGFGFLKRATYQGWGSRRLTYGDWPFESSLVGRADFLEARAATHPTSPRCTASRSF